MMEIENFKVFKKKINQGDYGYARNVYYAQNTKTEELVAAKRFTIPNLVNMPQNQEIFKEIIRETYKHIVNLKNVFMLENREMWILMEYCNMGNLGTYYQNYNVDEVYTLKFCRDIVRGIHFLHQKKIVHGDVKPSNILINFNNEDDIPSAKISNFVIQTLWEKSPFIKHKLEDKTFKPPEIFCHDGIEKLTEKVDIFALGLVYLAMIRFKKNTEGSSKLVPVDPESPENLIESFGEHIFRLQQDRKTVETTIEFFVPITGTLIEQKIQRLVRKMITDQPENRPTAAGIYVTIDDLFEDKKMLAKPPEKPDNSVVKSLLLETADGNSSRIKETIDTETEEIDALQKDHQQQQMVEKYQTAKHQTSLSEENMDQTTAPGIESDLGQPLVHLFHQEPSESHSLHALNSNREHFAHQFNSLPMYQHHESHPSQRQPQNQKLQHHPSLNNQQELHRTEQVQPNQELQQKPLHKANQPYSREQLLEKKELHMDAEMRQMQLQNKEHQQHLFANPQQELHPRQQWSQNQELHQDAVHYPQDTIFQQNDVINIWPTECQLKELQKEHGGFVSEMKAVIGSHGIVHGYDKDGDVLVESTAFALSNRIFTLNKLALRKVTSSETEELHRGDLVMIENDVDKLKSLQDDLNGAQTWSKNMKNICGQTAYVSQIKDKHLIINLNSRKLVLVREAVRLVATKQDLRTHWDVECDECGNYPVTGIRLNCEKHNLCGRCKGNTQAAQHKNTILSNDHKFEKITKSEIKEELFPIAIYPNTLLITEKQEKQIRRLSFVVDRSSPINLSVGDEVYINSDLDLLRKLQNNHGDFVCAMKQSLGKIGSVMKTYRDRGVVKVRLEGHKWRYNVQCVTKVVKHDKTLKETEL